MPVNDITKSVASAGVENIYIRPLFIFLTTLSRKNSYIWALGLISVATGLRYCFFFFYCIHHKFEQLESTNTTRFTSMSTSHLSTLPRAHGGSLTTDYAVARHIVFFKKEVVHWIRKFLPEPIRQKNKVQLQFVPSLRSIKVDLFHAHKRSARVEVNSGHHYCWRT